MKRWTHTRLTLLALVVALPVLGHGQTGRSELQREIEYEVMAPCCYGSPVAEHESEAAMQVKGQIAQLISEGRNKEEILDMYVAIYGERILASPRAEGFNLLAYIMPPLFLLFGGIMVVYVINQLKLPATAPVAARSANYNDEFYSRVEQEMRELGI
ncbi:MAG: cytochrome c-type biogenesis protein CcmH [Candidatus Marinimicrobia bacterium]|nr:cytochrome c-type biogenesis protein CcmH [Candidatus Neomarinimicrobiota bacterium]